jgi:hypothetical protein
MIAVARADIAMGNAAHAQLMASDAKVAYEKHARTKHSEYAEALVVLGKATALLESPKAAEPLLRQALEVIVAVKPASRLKVASVRAELAELLASMNRSQEAQAEMTASLALIRDETGENSKQFARAQQRLAKLSSVSDR